MDRVKTDRENKRDQPTHTHPRRSEFPPITPRGQSNTSELRTINPSEN